MWVRARRTPTRPARSTPRRSPARCVAMPTAAPDFRIFWDNAYAVHHLTDVEHAGARRARAGRGGGQPGPGVRLRLDLEDHLRRAPASSFFGGSPANVAWYLAAPRQADHRPGQGQPPPPRRYLQRRRRACGALMRAHRAILAPKFDAGRRDPAPSGSARYERGDAGPTPTAATSSASTSPTAPPPGSVALAKAAGIAMTGAGAAFPYGRDPRDRNIRIAPIVPAPDDVAAAIDGLATCVLLAAAEQRLRASVLAPATGRVVPVRRRRRPSGRRRTVRRPRPSGARQKTSLHSASWWHDTPPRCALDPACGSREPGHRRAIAQLAEHRSPKPKVGGSSPSCPARRVRRTREVHVADRVDEATRQVDALSRRSGCRPTSPRSSADGRRARGGPAEPTRLRTATRRRAELDETAGVGDATGVGRRRSATARAAAPRASAPQPKGDADRQAGRGRRPERHHPGDVRQAVRRRAAQGRLPDRPAARSTTSSSCWSSCCSSSPS